MPVLNRGQTLNLQYVCTRPHDDLSPTVYINVPVKGVRLVRQPRVTFILGVPAELAAIPGPRRGDGSTHFGLVRRLSSADLARSGGFRARRVHGSSNRSACAQGMAKALGIPLWLIVDAKRGYKRGEAVKRQPHRPVIAVHFPLCSILAIGTTSCFPAIP